MAGSARTPTLTALLCLGLCRGLWNQALAGTLPKPSIWADPGRIVTQGRPVTIWCQASLRADGYYLYKERVSEPFWETSPDSSNKAGFSFASMSSHTAGRYQCAYHSRNIWSQKSDFLPLVVTGVYGAPSLSANPGPVVALGGTVSLSCSSQEAWQSFRLLKEGGADAPQQLELTSHRETYHALFPVGPVNTSHAGTYRCYASPQSYPHSWSQPSDPLHLQVTGVYREPSLSAQPGSLVQSGDSLTLQCRSETGFGRFALTKDEELRAPQRLDGQASPSFPLGPVSHTHGGRYRCYGGHNLSSTWSAPSAPLDILITGIYEKPSLSAQLGPSVSWGENVTLQCRSEIWFDTFHLSKEGSLAPPQVLHLQDPAIPYQVNFTLSPVTSDHEGTYRCYGSHSGSPYLLSHPSDPLKLLVSGDSEDAPLLWQKGPHWYLYVLIGAVVAFVLLLGLLVLLLVRHRRRGKGRKRAAAVAVPEDRGPPRSSGPAAAAQEETLYAVVKDTQPEDRQLASQAAVSEDQDVTYAQLSCFTLTRETSAPPSSQSGEPPEEPNVYASLAIH
ncbi:LOW QUALITY PROTEIN: leukocyte immunoglobulin-like receptor subfamily B member 3 [Ursus americanus]|uniref:LOW QUALITY PROTEIN: leukocyte immunoglobulin-like receptor subfamily B member 3 n=1 Tax=Ursus americanus TaxID=9643 RepID=UPI001E67DF16|nr:LOW QUALITY PROTEIN: leukocyte immunoglobulin-like receptor subfamily B member 3 [Ursus americanus]